MPSRFCFISLCADALHIDLVDLSSFSLRLLYTYRILKAAFHFFVCAGVGESKKVSLPDSLIVICARLDGILSRVVVTSADFSAR